MLKILGRQNTIIAQLNTDSDAVFQQLTDKREDVVRFIDEAEDTARISAERREDLATNFDRLDDFLFELKPVMHELGNLAREQTPLLTDLRAAAPGAEHAGHATCPPSTRPPRSRSSRSATPPRSATGPWASRPTRSPSSTPPHRRPSRRPTSSPSSWRTSTIRANAVEEDCDARYDLREQPGEADRRVGILEQKLGTNLTGRHDIAPSAADPIGCDLDPGSPTGNPGYTGLEGLLNYAYVQPAALNLFDGAGHALQIHLVGASPRASRPGEGGGECGHVVNGTKGGWPTATSTTPIRAPATTTPATRPRPPTASPSSATTSRASAPARSLPGGLTDFTPGAPGGELRKYDSSVCPDGSTRLAICDPSAPTATPPAFQSASPASAPAVEVPSVEEARGRARGPEEADRGPRRAPQEARPAAGRAAAARGDRRGRAEPAAGRRTPQQRASSSKPPAATSSTSSSAHDRARPQPRPGR